MNLRVIATILSALTFQALTFAGPEPSTQAPPRKGEPLVWPGPWTTSQKKHPAEKFLRASTDDIMRVFKGPVEVPNEEMEEMKGKVNTSIPSRFTNLPDQNSEFGIQANTLLTSNLGIGQTSLRPPDNDMAVADNYIVDVVNSTWRIMDKCGNVLYENTINNFLGDNGFLFDPKVFFDPWRRRWSMLWHRKDNAAGTAHLVTVSSDDDDPFGTWWVYYFRVDDGGARWTDYADWGYGSGSVDAAGDEFTFGGSFQFCRFFTFNPTEIYSNTGASVVWNDFANNPDGSQTFAPRVAKQMNNGLGGAIFINSRSGGGTKLTEWLLANPLGARSWTYYDINVASYSNPPDAKDPAGNTIQTNACQLMPVYNVFHPDGKWRLCTSLNTQNPSETTQCSARLYVIDPFARTVELDWNFFATGSSSFYASPSANYAGSCNWVLSRSGSAIQPQARYVNFDLGAFSNSSNLLRAGVSNYGDSRWGDYHGGSQDWGDYWFGSGSQKMWFTGEFAAGTFSFGTVNGATLSLNAVPGTLSVTGANSMTFSGYVGGGYSPSSYQNTLANTGTVGFNWEATTPSYMTANVTSGQLWGNSATQNVTVSPNAGMNALGFGKHTGTVSYQNCYNNATVNIPTTVYSYGLVLPSSFNVIFGRVSSGNNASLGGVDNNFLTMCRFIVPNNTVPPIRVEVLGTAPGNSVGYVDFLTYVKMVTSGLFQQTMEMFNYQTNAYDATDVRTDVINTTVQRFDLISSGTHSRFIGPGNAVKARFSIRQTGPAAAVTWCSATDFAGWIIAPTP